MSPPCVVIAKAAYDPWQKLFEAAALPVRYALVHDPETAILDGKRYHPTELPAEVIWMTIETLRGPLRKSFKHLLENAPLRWAQSIGAGWDMPIMQNILQRGARLTTAHTNSVSITEHVLRAVLDRFQRIDERREARARREYPRDDFQEIYHTTWLIYGVGAIGGGISKRARAFDAYTIGVRRNPTGTEPVDEMIKPADLLQHVGRADVVVFAMPSTADTQNIANAEFFARMKPGAIFVNVARAALMDETALLAALDSGHLDYAVLDVHSVEEAWLYRKERMDDHPLWSHPRVDLRRFVAGEKPLPDEVWLGKA
jgi:phosphoglycerate dehydrogenase-like enzyme